MTHHSSYVTVDLDAIRHNITAVAQKAGVPVMAVIKANAYGHGAVAVARALKDLCSFFGVACAAEALELRRGGIEAPILIFGYTDPADFPALIQQQIRPALYTLAGAEAFSAEACRQGITAPFHIAVDTGMGRIGVLCNEEGVQTCLKMAALPNLHPEGIFSHYATADCADLTAAGEQRKKFDAFVYALRSRGLEIPLPHLNNSAAVVNFESHYAMVRSGIITYGIDPSREADTAVLQLQPALSWHSRIAHLKTLPAGSPISYGATCVTARETVVATLPVGYADGYPRNLSGSFYVLICGKKAPILGRICMDQMMVDVTDIPEAALGSTVTLLGKSGREEITAMALAEASGRFHYELLTLIGRRVDRRYIPGSPCPCGNPIPLVGTPLCGVRKLGNR